MHVEENETSLEELASVSQGIKNLAVLGGDFAGYFNIDQSLKFQEQASQESTALTVDAETMESATYGEITSEGLIAGDPLPSMPELLKSKKLAVKYVSVTGYFNRAHKRELARRIEKNKRREITHLVCSICRLAQMGKINRCQCPVQKPARKDSNT